MNLVKKIKDQFKAESNIRVLFFFDEKQEFVNEIEAMESSDFKIINAEKAHFKLKIDLEQKLSKVKVFLYFPYGKPVSKDEKKKFLLLDILIANKELLLDEVGDFMNEYQLLPTQESLVRTFIDELKFKKNQKVLLNYLTPSSFEDRHIVRGLISSYLEFPVVKEPSICLAKMMVWTLPEYDKKYAQFEKKIKLDYVNKLISKWFFYYFEIVIEKITKDDILSSISKLN